MKDTQPLPADNPKDALTAFLLEIDKSYYSWYEHSVKRLRRLWHPLYWSLRIDTM
jgi:hypothetical protein